MNDVVNRFGGLSVALISVIIVHIHIWAEIIIIFYVMAVRVLALISHVNNLRRLGFSTVVRCRPKIRKYVQIICSLSAVLVTFTHALFIQMQGSWTSVVVHSISIIHT